MGFNYQSMCPGSEVTVTESGSRGSGGTLSGEFWGLTLTALSPTSVQACSCKDATQPQSEMCHNNREPPQFICQWIKGPLTCPNLTSREDGTADFLGFQKRETKSAEKITSSPPPQTPFLLYSH